MARKSMEDILKSEKYMNDAVGSIFYNLHKAAKKKSEYIWSLQKFSSFDSIWGDPVERESDKILNTSKLCQNSKHESKILKQQNCGIGNEQSTIQVHECNPVEVIMPDKARKTEPHTKQTTKVLASQKTSDSIWGNPVELKNNEAFDVSKVSKYPKHESKILKKRYNGVDNKQNTTQVHECNPVEVVIPHNARKIALCSEQTPKVSATLKPSSLQNFGDNNEGKRNSKYSNPANQVLNADEQYLIRAKGETLKRNPDVCRISEPKYKWGMEISQRKENFRGTGTLKTKEHSQYIFEDAEHSSKLISENYRLSASNAEKNEGVKSHSNEAEYQNNIKSKLNYSDKPRREKAIERVARKRRMTSSVNNLFPEQKHIPIENQKYDTVDKKIMSKYLQLKIFKGDKFFDFTLEVSDFNRMKRRFPKLQEVLPEIDGDEKEFNYSADAVKVVFGFLHNLRYLMPDDERTVVEVLAASKSWEMYQFHDEFKQKFSENLNVNNARLAYGAAVHYDLREICNAYKCAFGVDMPSNERPYRPRKCNVSVSTYIEPREFCIPSKISTSTLEDNFDKDIRNEIKFKAVAGSFVITGFRVLLDVDNEHKTDSINLEFFYAVRNFKSLYEEDLKVRKPLRRNIAIYFKRSLVVNENETAEIVVESSIKPYLCFAIQENNFVERCDESLFSMNVTSTYKVKNSNEKRFFIGKLLYYPKT